MKRLILLAVAALAVLAAFAAEAPEKPWRYTDARELRIVNKGFDNTERPYWRIPAYLKDSVRPDLWSRQMCSAGIAVRFATNSSRIGVRYTLLWNTHMIHMADTGLKGTDLYVWQGDSVWRHVNTNRPYVKDKESLYAVPNHSLCAFQRVSLQAQERTAVDIRVPGGAFLVVNEEGERIWGSGNYVLYVGTGQPDKRTEELSGKKSIEVCVTF